MKLKTYKIEDLKGKMFGFLEVISEAEQKNGNRYVTCKCHRCGNIKDIYLYSLTRGITTSCGCGHKNNLIGKRFGKLEVVDYTKSRKGKTFWLCRCDCGNIKEVEADALVKGATTTCGCRKTPTGVNNPRYKHGLTKNRIMKIWTGMKGRCYNPKDKAYKNYGGRGIRICDEWRENLKNFYDWSMLNGYNDTLTIDRIDVNGNYEPSNCRWATRKVQCNNQRNNHYIYYKGERLTISQIAEKYNLSKSHIVKRIHSGWDEIRAIETPVKVRGKYKRKELA